MTRRSKGSRQWVQEPFTDYAKSARLGELALDMGRAGLEAHGHALIKVFQGAGFPGAGQGGPEQIRPGKAAEASRFQGSERRDVFAGHGLSLGVAC
jgi:hypothetical protein